MVIIGQAVYDGHIRIMREGGYGFMAIGAEHNAINKTGENFGGVFNCLAAPDLHIITCGGDRTPAKLTHPHIKAEPCAGRGFFKYQRERFALKRCVRIEAAFG